GRYEADYYRDGNPWVLSTLWLALAAVCQSEESNAPIRASHIQLARTAWTWVLRHMPEEGQLPEQIDPVNGRASWVMPLTWSHAMFALAVQQLPKEVLQ
ncbi:MAG: hypothetical protein NTX25_22710, partial [Proteobacteria bacterium]|nr:hypothetical protein [Pseudomonadota bacterium]